MKKAFFNTKTNELSTSLREAKMKLKKIFPNSHVIQKMSDEKYSFALSDEDFSNFDEKVLKPYNEQTSSNLSSLELKKLLGLI